MNEDIKSAFGFAARVAVDQSFSFDDLVGLLRAEYENAQRVGKQRDVSKGEKLEEVRRGFFVTYVDPKKGQLMSHVLEVREKNKLKIRVHMGTSNQDLDLDDVPYSAKPKKEHWSYR